MLRRRAINVPRRTLRRHARSLPVHLQLRQLLVLVERERLPVGVDAEVLHAALRAVWVAGLGVWSVSELKSRGILPARIDARRFGQILAELADDGRAAGPWIVQRADHGQAKRCSEGRLWQLARRW